ncbi:translation initiation factor [Bacteroidota bacterium]
MAKHKKNKAINVVYSTNPDYEFEYGQDEEMETLEPAEQLLKISLDKKNRKGKTVVLISGFVGESKDLESLAKAIKSYCGVGGSAKEGEIVIQGDQKKKINNYLLSQGYRVKLI